MNSWEKIQANIWRCELCSRHDRVAYSIRQQTAKPNRAVKLLLMGIAPPYVRGVIKKKIAESATNDPEDNLRNFIQEALQLSWSDLLVRGLFLVHSVKCAIVPENRHQNPPNDVVDICAPRHFAEELKLIQPPRVAAFGKVSYRALLKVPGMRTPRNLNVSNPLARLAKQTKHGVELQLDEWIFRLHVSPFPSGQRIPLAVEILQEAAQLAGISRAGRLTRMH